MGDIMKLKSILALLTGITFLLVPCFSSMVGAMEPAEPPKSSKKEKDGDPRRAEIMAMKSTADHNLPRNLLAYLNNGLSNQDRENLMRETFTGYSFTSLTSLFADAYSYMLQNNQASIDTDAKHKQTMLESFSIMVMDAAHLAHLAETILDKISDQNIRDAVALMAFKAKNKNMDRTQLMINYFHDFLLPKLPEVAYDAIIAEGIAQGKINKIARPVLMRQQSFLDKIVHLINHDLIDFKWLEAECKKYESEMNVGAQDVNQQ